MRRWSIRVALLLLLTTVAVAAAIAWRLWQSLPETSGTLHVGGLHQPVEIVRDPEGVPHIRARSEADALFALGYVHAQDRLWQMDFQRRLAAGRLAEILGAAAVDTDRLMRTIGFARAARTAVAAMAPETRALVDRYIAGVNAYLEGHGGRKLPVEFAIFRFSPEPWRAEDVLAWQKVMGWSMSTNWREEMLRVRLSARVGPDGASDLLPAYAAGGPLVLPEFQPAAPTDPYAVSSKEETAALARAALNFFEKVASDPIPPGGSNNWVVSGSRTATGKPLLANDPHLGTQAPAVWYVAHLTGGPLDVIGATLPGAPAVVIGHNKRIAWGVTNMMSDVQDLFAERINERDEALVDGRWEPMRILHEAIAVRDAPPVALRVRLTRHGPLVSDLFDERAALALRWTGHDPSDRTAEAFLRVNRAESWDGFAAAFEGYHLPMLNFVYADVDGNIAYLGPGALPVRAGDGRAPVDGSSTGNDWRGYVPLPELPRTLNPARGFIASANNQVVSPSYPHPVSTSWDAPYRAARITEVLASMPRATLDDMKLLQTDQRSAQPIAILPFLLQAAPRSDAARDAIARLARWNRSLAADSAPAALFKAYYARAARRIVSDELGQPLWNDYRPFTGSVAKAFDGIARDPLTRWCDDVNTAPRETCPDILGGALEEALADLRLAQRSGDPDAWRWDRQNEVWFPHLPLQASPVLRPFFSRRVRRGGDAFTVNPSMPVRDQMLVSSYRQIVDLSNLDASVFILPLGQSGQIFSGRYSDLLNDWNEGRYRPLRFSRAAVDAAAERRLVLEPH
ncbi:MAG: penicillin acylase family protein [Acidobacteria bacterium]|nr:penicillin acylase family protein [Acidobacteriota bacterium]